MEGLEYFGDVGKSKYLANHSVMFMLRGLACKWKKAIGYFVTSSTKSPDLLNNIHLKCSKLFHLFIAAKQYQDLPTDGHVVPSSDSREVFTLIEAQFRNNVENILHMSKVKCRLFDF